MNRQVFFSSITHSLFGGKLWPHQKEGMDDIFEIWLSLPQVGRRQHLSYMLATAYHETAKAMIPVKEGFYLGDQGPAFRKKLRYFPWYGRGLIQLTWKSNYLRAKQALGSDFISSPNLALESDLAIKIMFLGMGEGWFRKDWKGRPHTLSRYLYPGHTDFIGARNIINGKKKGEKLSESAEKIASYAEAFDEAILLSVKGI